MPVMYSGHSRSFSGTAHGSGRDSPQEPPSQAPVSGTLWQALLEASSHLGGRAQGPQATGCCGWLLAARASWLGWETAAGRGTGRGTRRGTSPGSGLWLKAASVRLRAHRAARQAR